MLTESFAGEGDASVIVAGPLEQPRRQLEAGVLLADDEDALVGVRLGRARAGVVRDELDPRRVRHPGSATPTAKMSDRGAVLAVARLEDELLASAAAGSRRVPVQRQPWRIAMPVRVANVARFCSISGRDGKYELPSISPGMDRLVLGLVGEEAVPVVALVGRVPCGTGAYGFVHDSSRWKNGQRRNMPPGASSAESMACSIP